ncbi:MAG: adenylyl-sulfate kinase [Betaproteobacteria bacterium]|nr:adenylyl-sulfate kinase [Betaproteobacteria bacterium]
MDTTAAIQIQSHLTKTIGKVQHSTLMGQAPKCIWLTGLSGAGKSTLARAVEERLYRDGLCSYLLDGDDLRLGLNRDLGFDEAARTENIRRVAEVARLMLDAGLIVLVAAISPYRAGRRMARALFNPGEFIEVFVDTPIEVCERRDPKGMYAKARRGELARFTGIDSPYEIPREPELRLDTSLVSLEDCTEAIVEIVVRQI